MAPPCASDNWRYVVWRHDHGKAKEEGKKRIIPSPTSFFKPLPRGACRSWGRRRLGSSWTAPPHICLSLLWGRAPAAGSSRAEFSAQDDWRSLKNAKRTVERRSHFLEWGEEFFIFSSRTRFKHPSKEREKQTFRKNSDNLLCLAPSYSSEYVPKEKSKLLRLEAGFK